MLKGYKIYFFGSLILLAALCMPWWLINQVEAGSAVHSLTRDINGDIISNSRDGSSRRVSSTDMQQNTIAVTGMTSVNATCDARKTDDTITISIGMETGQGNGSATLTIPGCLDADYRPNDDVAVAAMVQNNGTYVASRVFIQQSDGNVIFELVPAGTFDAGGGNEGIFAGRAWTISFLKI